MLAGVAELEFVEDEEVALLGVDGFDQDIAFATEPLEFGAEEFLGDDAVLLGDPLCPGIGGEADESFGADVGFFDHGFLGWGDNCS